MESDRHTYSFIETDDDQLGYYEKDQDLKIKDIIFNSYKDFFKSVIFDEGHKVKEPNSLQTKLTKGICMNKEYIFDLTGTPVLNKVNDLAAQLHIIEQIHNFGGYNSFVQKYEDAEKHELEALHYKLLNTCVIRRLKKECLDLPPKKRDKIMVDIPNRAEYDLALNDLKPRDHQES